MDFALTHQYLKLRSIVKSAQLNNMSTFSENLPYSSSFEGEADTLLNEIVENLCSSAKAQDWGPGCGFWVKQLNG